MRHIAYYMWNLQPRTSLNLPWQSNMDVVMLEGGAPVPTARF